MQKLLVIFMLLTVQLAVAQQKQISLQDAVLGRYTYLNPESLDELQWKNDQVFSWIENNTLLAKDVKRDNKFTIISLQEVNDIIKQKQHFQIRSFNGYSWSEKEELILNDGINYFSLDLKSKSISWHIKLPIEAENPVLNEQKKFVAYTIKNDLYLSYSGNKVARITNDGGSGIVNGKTVHRSEFGITNGIFISPNGNYIAFYRKDESMVTDYPLVDFMTRVAEHSPVKYPMAGMNSHHVTVGIYELATGETIFLKTGEPAEKYLTNISWSPDEKSIYIAELNRGQDHMIMNQYNTVTGEKLNTLFEEKHDKYVEPLNPLLFSKTNASELFYLSRKNGWFHIYKYNTTGALISPVTKGEWEVSRILGFSDKEKYIYFEATKESPLELHLYRAEIKNGRVEKLTSNEGIHRGLLSSDGSYLIDEYSSPDIPSKIDLISSNGKNRKTIHTADNPLKEYQLGTNKMVPIMSADGKYELTGRLILPTDFNPAKKYPVVVYVYGGPHSQLVNKSWLNAANWWQYYMAGKGFISFTMDNRGTNNRGKEFETTIHRKLGLAETEDQMQGIEYLQSLPYIDAERIGVHGWSYGGFMTLNMMLRHPETFKVGVAGGPVVDWSMYEIMYGERYMDRPQENQQGYHETNMLNHVRNLDGKLMLIHGVQDDVVVMQHSMQFLRECVKLEKQVDFFVYPTHPHNVRGKDRIHLMEKVSRYFIENL
ncbi:MAG TPA: DPP IV N-terminal domain-containing protein [Mariniphaga sp.]|nr:DPP IV N-terminal domain-containing protein [Mariniphaga sp.]